MNAAEILNELATLGNENTKRIFLGHGAKEPIFGVKVGDLQKIKKRAKKNYELALDLYETGNSDAMYLAGLVADEKKMSAADLQKWVEGATWFMLAEYPVAQVAAESAHGWELGLRWIESDKELVAAGGWSTLSFVISLKPDEELDLPQIEKLLERVKNEIHSAPNRVRYTMNGFVIAVGSFVAPLSEKAVETAAKLGKVKVDMGGTACQVPDAQSYIAKVAAKNKIGKKRKMARC